MKRVLLKTEKNEKPIFMTTTFLPKIMHHDHDVNDNFSTMLIYFFQQKFLA